VGRDEFPALCARVGTGLAQFHRLPVTLPAVSDAAATGERLAAEVIDFATMLPGERGRLVNLAGELRARLAALPPGPLPPTHGDFHGDNILVDGTRLALVDLEDCAMGEPADDVGANWAQLTWHTLRAGGRGPAPAGREAFVAAYLADADADTVARVPLYAALH